MSRQEILDDPGATFPHLRQFLGAYFHQDWAVDRHGWEEVVDDFVAESPPSEVVATVEELRDLIAEGFTDAELDSALSRLDGSITAAALEMGTAEWLAAVVRSLDVGDT